MDKQERNMAIVKERQEAHTKYHVLGEKYGITTSRAHQIVKSNKEFYAKLPHQKKQSGRIRRVTLTKTEVAEKLGIPEDKLELRV